MNRIRDEVVTCRKPRKCFGCLAIIKGGDLAHVQTNTEDGKIFTTSLCGKCNEKTKLMRYDDEFSEGDLKGD